jgi:ATP-binding cassette subfamily F protein 3
VVNAHPAVKIGFFEQTNVQTLDPQNTVEQEIDSAIRDRERYTARAIAGAMMFEGDNSQKRIGVLSGGEKNRVMLGKLIATPCNLLLLDEPTNHLDMQSADSLLAALDAFEGAVVIATHNEMFLRTLVNKLIIFDHGGITVYNGGYDDFLREIGWDNETDDRAEPESLKPVVSKKDTRKWRADIVAQKSKELKPIENQMNKLEDEITSLESESAEVSHSFEQATMTGDAAKIRELGQRMSELDKQIESLYERLSVLSDEYDEKKKYYDEML